MSRMTIRLGLALVTAVLAAGGRLHAQSQPAGGKWEPAGKTATEEPKKEPPSSPGAEEPKKEPTGSGPATTRQGRTQQAPCGGGGMDMTMWVMIGGVILLFLFMGRGKRRQEATRREMLANLKKGDKVTSIGGIIGTIVDVRDEEVVVKVDDDTRLHLARWAVRGVGEDAKAESPEQAKKKQQEKR